MRPDRPSLISRVAEPAAIAVVVVAVTLVVSAWRLQSPSRAEVPPRVDFLQFYALGHAVLHADEREALVSTDAWTSLLERLAPGRADYPRVYGPQVGLAFAPLAVVGLYPAYLLWSVASLAVFGLCVRRFELQHARPSRRLTFWLVVGTLAYPPLVYVLVEGQASVLAVVALLVVTTGLTRRSTVVVGVGVGLLAFKPTLFVPALAVLLCAGEARVAAVGLVTGALTLLTTWPIVGLSPTAAYLSTMAELARAPEVVAADPSLMVSLRTFWAFLAPPAAVTWFYAATAGATVIAAAVSWRRIADPLRRVGMLSVAVTLVAPHVYVYDLLILAPAFVAAAHWLRTAPRAANVTWSTAGAYAAPLFAPMAAWTHVQFATLLYAVWFLVMRRVWASEIAARTP